jgi:signal transduction histidine kinase
VNSKVRAQAEVGQRRHELELEILDALTDLSTRGLSLAEVLSPMIAPLAARLGVTGGAVLLYDEDGDYLRTEFSWGGVEQPAAHLAAVSVERIETGRALRALLSRANLHRLRAFFVARVGINAEEQKSYLCIPVRSGEKVLGAAILRGGEPDAFREEYFSFFALLGRHVAIAVHNGTLSAQSREGREDLELLSRHVAEAQEDERRRLARELHDEMGQSLTGLKLLLEMSARSASGPALAALQEARELADKLLAQVRTISLNLRPSVLDDLGLLPTLLWHFDNYTRQTGVAVDFKHMGLDRRFGAAAETAAYRIVQEALTNVATHARVKEAIVLAWASDTTLGLQIEDRGVGFDQESARAARASSGLVGMRERAAALGGKFRLESSSEDGTVILAVLPFGSENTTRGVGDADGDPGR